MTSQPCMACGAKLIELGCKLRFPRCHTINETCGDGGERTAGWELGESNAGGKTPDSTPADDGSPATHRQKD